MDLSWCIICDNRIVDDELSMIDASDSLYCSQECRLKDEQQLSTTSAASSPLAFTPVETTLVETIKSSTTMKPWMTKKSAKHHIYRFNAPTTAYPWIPLYRKRHNYLMQSKRCCQPTVAGSPATATGVLSLIR